MAILLCHCLWAVHSPFCTLLSENGADSLETSIYLCHLLLLGSAMICLQRDEHWRDGQWVDAFYSICFMSHQHCHHMASSPWQQQPPAMFPQFQSQMHHYFSKIRAEGWANLINPSSHLLNFNNTNLFLLFLQLVTFCNYYLCYVSPFCLFSSPTPA